MMEKIKENGVLIGVALFVLVIIGFIFMSGTSKGGKPDSEVAETPVTLPETAPGTFTGSFKTGVKDQAVAYSFVVPADATSLVSDGGAYIVTTVKDAPFTKIYFMDERVKAETAATYLNNIIAPQVKGFTLKEMVKIADLSWQRAESASMEWHVAPVLSGNWLVMVESYKKDGEAVKALLASMKIADGADTPKEVEMATTDAAMQAVSVEGVEAN